jgi:DNA polymerase-3 subunit epsilon
VLIRAVLAVGAAIAGGLAGAASWRRRQPGGGLDLPLAGLDFVAIDTETTGLDVRRDALVALAAVPFTGGRMSADAAYTRLVNPGRPIPEEARAIHGIADADVRGAPTPAEALPAFLEMCQARVIVAHTAAFDLAVINRAARQAGLAVLDGSALDIEALANALFPSWWDLSLEGLGRLLEVETIDRHTARGDAIVAGAIFLRMIPLLERRRVTTVDAALRFQRRGSLAPDGPGPTGGGLAGP